MLGKMPIGKAVSIHTPTKGVTNFSEPIVTALPVSIHTPTKGVTLYNVMPQEVEKFQSTHPRRV